MKGYIKDFRKELQSDVWLMPPLYHRVWQYLKYKVNHKENKIPMRDGAFLTVTPGQHLTSIRTIANNVGWYERGVFKTPNPKTISSILDWLEKQQMIKIERGQGNRQYTLITLINWHLYQSEEDESNSKETVRKQSMDINKNDNNDNNISTTTTDAIIFYQENFGVANPFISESILNWINDSGEEMVLEAMKRSVKRNKTNWGYVERILTDWHKKGITTVEQAKAEEIEFQNRFTNIRQFKPKQRAIGKYDPTKDRF